MITEKHYVEFKSPGNKSMSKDDADPEIVALYAVSSAVEALDIPARKRVLEWALARWVDQARREERKEGM